jgi:hypothetical protein
VLAAIAFSNEATVVAAGTSGISVSVDAGETWRSISAEVRDPLSLAFVGAALLAGTAHDGVLVSSDRGDTWRRSNTGLSARLFTALGVSPDFAHDRVLFRAGPTEGVHVSPDAGHTWRSELEDVTVSGLTASRTGTLYAATSSGIYISRDGGRNWQSAAAGCGAARAVVTGEMILAAFESGMLAVSEDDAATWRPVPSPCSSGRVIGLATARRHLFVGTSERGEVTLWRSDNADGSWQRLRVERGQVDLLPLTVSPGRALDDAVFVGLASRVMAPVRDAREVRSGESRPLWRATSLGRGVTAVTALATSERTVFAATNDGVFVSRDAGEHFGEWSHGLDQRRMIALALSPTYASDRLVFSMSAGGTVWQRRDAASHPSIG